MNSEQPKAKAPPWAEELLQAKKLIKMFLEHSRECANDWEHDLHYEDIVIEAEKFLTGSEPVEK